MTPLLSVLVVAALAAVPPPAPAGQEPPPAAQESYEVALPDGWQRIEYKDGAGIPRVEYVYQDRASALLKVRRVRPAAGEGPPEISKHELETVLRFTPGFVRGKTEDFGGGKLGGVMVEYDFTRGGKPMLGRVYYLKGGEGSVWVLHFTGGRPNLAQLRAATDRIARDFAAK